MPLRPANLVHTERGSFAESTRSGSSDGSLEPGSRSSAVERHVHTVDVTGSIPVATTIPVGPYWGFMQPGAGHRWDNITHIYVVSSGPCGRFRKVGIATDIQRRLCSLQGSTPHQLTLELALPTLRPMTAQIEKRVHQELSACHVRGEWFEVDHDTAAAAVKRWSQRGNDFLKRLAREIEDGRRNWEPLTIAQAPPRRKPDPRPRPPRPGPTRGSSSKDRLASYKAARGLA